VVAAVADRVVLPAWQRNTGSRAVLEAEGMQTHANLARQEAGAAVAAAVLPAACMRAAQGDAQVPAGPAGQGVCSKVSAAAAVATCLRS
jgi:hypothetical protein